MCVKDNLVSAMKEIISKVTSGVQTLSEVYNNKNRLTSSIRTTVCKLLIKLLKLFAYYYFM